MIKRENYINIQGWMVLPEDMGGLGLKNNELLIFAIIYGFTQIEDHYFSGTLNYLEEWTGSTKQSVINNLNSLVDRGYVIKINSGRKNLYYANYEVCQQAIHYEVKKVDLDGKESLPEGKKSLPNNNIYNKNNIEQYVGEIITYFNKVCGTSFKTTTSDTVSIISKRLKEGFKVEDFMKVIDHKYNEWGKNPKRFNSGKMSIEYLRPGTLFGKNFENYLYEANVAGTSEGLIGYSRSVKESGDISDLVF